MSRPAKIVVTSVLRTFCPEINVSTISRPALTRDSFASEKNRLTRSRPAVISTGTVSPMWRPLPFLPPGVARFKPVKDGASNDGTTPAAASDMESRPPPLMSREASRSSWPLSDGASVPEPPGKRMSPPSACRRTLGGRTEVAALAALAVTTWLPRNAAVPPEALKLPTYDTSPAALTASSRESSP